jgi:hypothetical protein
MDREEIVASLYRCFNASSTDSDINIVRIHHLLDLVAETERENAAKVCDGMSSKYCMSAVAMECAAAIRSMK